MCSKQAKLVGISAHFVKTLSARLPMHVLGVKLIRDVDIKVTVVLLARLVP